MSSLLNAKFRNMMLSSAILSCLLPLALSIPMLPSLDKRYTILADGTSMQYGTLTDGSGLEWQASGILALGGCKYSVDQISNCYHLSLTDDPDGQLETGSPSGNRQRIEFLTPGAPDGQIWQYNWKYFLANGTGSSSHFFHLTQLFSRAIDNPVMTVDAINGVAAIENAVTPCNGGPCASISLGKYEGITTYHDLTVQFGTSGRVQYTISNFFTGKTLLSYSYSGNAGSQSTSLKFGLYRLTEPGQTAASANVGDFVAEQLSAFP